MKLLAVAACVLGCIASANSLNFLVLGDWGAAEADELGLQQLSAVSQAMGRVGLEKNIEFVISTGDNFYDQGISTPDDPLFAKDFTNMFTAPSLQVPWYVAMGNHDYQGVVDAQLRNNKTDHRWFAPERYFTVRVPIDSSESLRLVVLDTNPAISSYYSHPANAQMAKELATQSWSTQLDWITTTLKTSESTWTLVVGHHPVFATKPCGGDANSQDLQDDLEDLLTTYKVPAYYSGHSHDLELSSKNNVDYFVSGGGSQVRECSSVTDSLGPSQLKNKHSVWHSNSAGFMLVELTPTSLTTTVYDENAYVLYTRTSGSSQ